MKKHGVSNRMDTFEVQFAHQSCRMLFLPVYLKLSSAVSNYMGIHFFCKINGATTICLVLCVSTGVVQGHRYRVYTFIYASVLSAQEEDNHSGKISCYYKRGRDKMDTDDIFNHIFLNENILTLIEISLKIVPKGPINNIPALVQIMAWRRTGDKPLSEPMMVRLQTHIWVTRPQWVNTWL